MAMPFDPIEIDDLDESLLADMTPEDMAEFREKLLATLDEMETFELVLCQDVAQNKVR